MEATESTVAYSDTIENRERFNITPLSCTQAPTEGIVQIEKFKQWLHPDATAKVLLQPIALKIFLVFLQRKLPKSQMKT
jgi:integrase/recombinase XerD